MNKNQIKKATALLLFGALVSGCGGGGGSAPAAPAAPVVAPTPVVSTPVAPPAPVVVVAPAPAVTVTASLTVPIVTSVPTPTYAVGSEELAAFNLLNAERSRCGFGMLAQNERVDSAAKSHADWQLKNGAYGHFEAEGTPLYVGATLEQRLVNAGYAESPQLFNRTEVLNKSLSPDKSGFGVVGVRGLLAAPYHLVGMMRNDLDVGIAVRSGRDVSGSQLDHTYLVIDMAHKYPPPITGSVLRLYGQSPSAGSVRTYPCDGSLGLSTLLRGENPSPTPTRDLSVSPVGTSVAIVLDRASALTIRGATLTHTVTGENVAILPIDNYKVNATNYLYQNEGFITADRPLAPFTAYKVTITGDDNGVAFAKTFTFTTGAAQ
jgi:hypothetical protein